MLSTTASPGLFKFGSLPKTSDSSESLYDFGIEHAVNLWVVCAVFGISQEYHFIGQCGADRRVGYHTVQGTGFSVKIDLDAIPFAFFGLQTKVDISDNVSGYREQMPGMGL